MAAGADPADLEARLGLDFTDKRLLRSALTHRSFLNEASRPDSDHNERLEFLGDALLDFVAGDAIYHEFTGAQEGELTALRAALVCEAALARYARRLELGAYVRLGRGEDDSGGRERPALLSDLFESLVAAIYLDAGFDAAERFMLPLLKDELAAVLAERHLKDAKSRLQEEVQSRWQVTPRYVTVAESGPDHAKHFVVQVAVGERVWGVGTGHSKSAAARRAASEALERLSEET